MRLGREDEIATQKGDQMVGIEAMVYICTRDRAACVETKHLSESWSADLF